MMVSSLHPKIHSSGSPQSQNAAVSTTAVATRVVKQLPMISWARSLFPSPMAIAALGAPPWAMSIVKAVMSVTMGRHRPTPVSATRPTSGIWPM